MHIKCVLLWLLLLSENERFAVYIYCLDATAINFYAAYDCLDTKNQAHLYSESIWEWKAVEKKNTNLRISFGAVLASHTQ